MNIWRVLGLEPTRDVAAIRRAYANAARQYHPEEQPEEFKRVRTAYEQAMAYARSTPHQSTISGSTAASPPPAKKYNALGNKAVPKKGGATGGSYVGPSRRPAGSRRPRAEARIEPLERRQGGPEPDWLREATSEGQAELFRQAPAMAAFQEVWQNEKKRSDKKAWREYFSSPVFLAVQREEGFAAALESFVEKEFKNGAQLPQKFLLELAIAYGIRYRSGKEIYYLSFAAFSGIESIRGILKLGQPLDKLNHEEDKIWAACWRDYFELLTLAKNGGFENPDRTRRWKELFDHYRKEKLTEKPEVTRKREEDVEFRHPYGLRLLASLVKNHPLPPAAVQYLYDSLQLETVGRSSAKRWYQPLLDAVLPVLPDQGPVRAEKEALAVVKSAVDSFLKVYDHRAPFSNADVLPSYNTASTPEEMQAAWAVIELPQFQQLLLTGRLEESGIIGKILGTPTALIPALTARMMDRQEEPSAKAIWGRCLEATHRWTHDPEYFYDLPYRFFGASPDEISLENREFWYYYLSTAFAAAFSTENEEFIGKVMKVYHPSPWWRRAFTGFDEGARRIVSPRSHTFRLGEHTVTVEFHFFYQRFTVDGEETGEAFPWPEFLSLAGEDHRLFWLALPLAMGEDGARRAIRREILDRMSSIQLDMDCGKLADCLVNHVCTSRKETAAARGWGEDGRILYGYEVRQNRTLEVYKAMGILHHREKLWNRPFPTVEDAAKAGAAYLETLLDPPRTLLQTTRVAGMTPRQKAQALVDCLGEGTYTQEDSQRDSGVTLNAVKDFLGYGVKHHGSYTADFYRRNLHRPYRAALRFGSQPGERFTLTLSLEVWPFGSPEAQKERSAELFTRMGTLGEACYVMGTIGMGKRSFTLVSSSNRRCLYALADGDQRNYFGKDLAALVETLLYPSEWDAVEQVEQYREGTT